MASLNIRVIDADDLEPDCCVLYLDINGKDGRLLFSGKISEELLERLREFEGRPMLLLLNPIDFAAWRPLDWFDVGGDESAH